MEKFLSNSSTLGHIIFKRFLSSFILLIIVFFALFAGEIGLKSLLVVIAFLSASEWCALVRITQKRMANRFTFVAICLAFIQIHFHYAYAAFGWLFLACSVSMFLSWLTWRRGFFWMGAGVLYVGIPTCACWALITLFDKYVYVLLWGILVVIANDTGGYIFGKLIGGYKLAPKISPKKTWAGLLGGFIFVGLANWYYYDLISFEMPRYLFLLTSLMLGSIASLGDLFESGVKRYHGRKDSGTLIPGHGGLLDRLDGFFATISILALLVFLQPSFFKDALPDASFLTVLLENGVVLD